MSEPRFYRPAWFLRLTVRLEDFGHANEDDTQDGAKPYKTSPAKAKKDQAAVEAKIAEEAAGRATGASRSRATLIGLTGAASALQRQAAVASQKSSAAANGIADPFSVSFVTVPTEMDIEDKGFRTANELTAAFPFQDMPLDPRIMRECLIEAWIGTVTGEDFASANKWHLKPEISKTSILRFRGYVDLPEMEHDENEGTIHIKARSYESVLIDGKIAAQAKAYRIQGAGGRETITAYVNRILSLYPPTSGDTGGDPFRAYWYAADPTKEPFLDRKTLVRSLQTAASRNAGNQGGNTGGEGQQKADKPAEDPDTKGQGGSEDAGAPAIPPKAVDADGMSIWDLITQACELCGCIPLYCPSLPAFTPNVSTPLDNPILSGLTQSGISTGKQVDPANCLLITTPQAFLDDIDSAVKIQGGARDGFQRDLTMDGQKIHSDVRFMVWGHNLAKMKLARKMGKVRVSAVEVRSYNPDANATLRVLSARYPTGPLYKAKGKKSNKMHEKGHGKIDVVRTFVLKGIRNIGMLEQAACSIYHQLTRNELTIELETDELASYMDPVASQQAGALVENHNENPDILRLCAGSPVHVTVAQKSEADGNLVISSLSEFYDTKANNIVELLTKQNDRWGTWRADGSLDQAKIEETARKIQAAYRAAKLPDVYYCRAVHLHFSADEGFSAHMELCNYMPDNDPKTFAADDQKKNDVTKKKKTSPAAKKQTADEAGTATVLDKTGRQQSRGVQ